MTSELDRFRDVWFVDFEYQAPPGENPVPLCMVAREWRSGRLIRLWREELNSLRAAPFPTGPDALFVAYNAAAELGCFLVLRWPFPVRVLDPYVEFKNLRSGLGVSCGFGLLGCLSYFGLNSLDVSEKETMRELAMRGGEYTDAERLSLLNYCQTDVDALADLLPVMSPLIDLPRALIRGRYMGAVARMQGYGVPIDSTSLDTLRDRWEDLQDRLVADVNRDYGVYEGRTFKEDQFGGWLAGEGIAWPHLDSGRLDLSSETFTDMGRSHPSVSLLAQLRATLSQLRLNALEVGADARNRVSLFPFASKTGRNQPSNTRFVFGPAVWLRGLIQPPPGRALAYVDWSQQEFGIAAALSHDPAMESAYESGDPYLTFGKQAGMIPPQGTKSSHKPERELCKACILGVQYGMGAGSLARRIGKAPIDARELLALHRTTYPTFWRWSDAVERHAMLFGSLSTVWGWKVHVGAEGNPRSLRNFPMQANGAEMMRLACCLSTESGIRVIAPVHDALMIEASAEGIDQAVAECQAHMRAASSAVLDGFELRSDADIVRHPDRYADERGEEMWSKIWRLVDGT